MLKFSGKQLVGLACLFLFVLGVLGCGAKDPRVSKEEEQTTRQHQQQYEAGMEAGN